MPSSWMNTVLQTRPSPSPTLSPSFLPNVSETTAPGQPDVERLAAPPSAPGCPRHSAARTSSSPVPAKGWARAGGRLAGRMETEVEALADRVESFAVELKEARKRSAKQHAEIARRQELQMVLMQGLAQQGTLARRSGEGEMEVCGVEAELSLAARVGGQCLARAQALIDHQPLSRRQHAIPCAPAEPIDDRDVARSTAIHGITKDAPSIHGFGRSEFRQATPDSQIARRDVRIGPSAQRQDSTEKAGQLLHAGWTAINTPASRLSMDHGPRKGSADEGEAEDSDWDDEAGETENDLLVGSSPSSQSLPKRRYNVPRQKKDRFACGPPGRPFQYVNMPRTILGIWSQWKHGTHGNPAIETLERQYGTSWRTGTQQELKYGSNYVGTRHRMVRYVEERARAEGLAPEELCQLLDGHVDRRIQQFLGAVKKGQDPFVVIRKRRR